MKMCAKTVAAFYSPESPSQHVAQNECWESHSTDILILIKKYYKNIVNNAVF